MAEHDTVLGALKEEGDYLRKRFGVRRIAVFGSAAKGSEGKNSDIDLFVEFEEPIGLSFMDFVDYVEKRLGRKVDILTPEGVKSIRVKKISEDIRRELVYV